MLRMPTLVRNTGRTLDTLLRRFAKSRRGNIAIMFALVVVPIIGLVGAAVDYSNAYRTKSRLQNALDATALAVNKSIGLVNEDELNQLAQDMFKSNLGSEAGDISGIDISIEDRVVTLQATADVQTAFMSIIGIDVVPVAARSKTVTGQQTFEIALVLDNSGSMSGSKLAALKDAAESLVDVLFTDQPTSDTIRIGVVPFAGAVNVGASNATAEWMDKNAISPVHSENFSTPSNRFDLYDNMANASWAGCIEARPYPLDVTDTAADPGTPETMFVPMFAPDEPDGYSNQYITNNYLNDQYSYYYNSGHTHGSTWHRHGSGGPYEWDQAQGNVAKYYPGVYASQSGVNGSTRGPNYQCQAKPITPLTNTRAIIDTALDDMVANGWTNIHMATMWGWRVLSSGAPFTQGMPEETPHNHKVIILMTDGANTHVGVNSPNKSMYSPYGFASNGRLRSPTSNTSLLVEAMDDRTEQACTNAKQHGILVYTVAFDLYDSGTVQMLRECASNPEMAFTPESGSDLVSTFQAIAAELSALRVAE